jgi:hypothetical protein
MSEQTRQSDPGVMKAMRASVEPPPVKQRALPTPERIRRAGADFDLEDTGQITMRPASYGRSTSSGSLRPIAPIFPGWRRLKPRSFIGNDIARRRKPWARSGRMCSTGWCAGKLHSIRSAIRWAGAAVRKAAAVERMKTALDELSKLWGLVR